jgi:hypothetical protein
MNNDDETKRIKDGIAEIVFRYVKSSGNINFSDEDRIILRALKQELDSLQ